MKYINTPCMQNLDILKVKVGGTYSNQFTLKLMRSLKIYMCADSMWLRIGSSMLMNLWVT
jgi:hypothetical protein